MTYLIEIKTNIFTYLGDTTHERWTKDYERTNKAGISFVNLRNIQKFSPIQSISAVALSLEHNPQTKAFQSFLSMTSLSKLPHVSPAFRTFTVSLLHVLFEIQYYNQNKIVQKMCYLWSRKPSNKKKIIKLSYVTQPA